MTTTAQLSAFEARYQDAIARARTLSARFEGPSLVERLARLPAAARDAILAELTPFELAALFYDWATWARPKQDAALDAVAHRIVFLLGGRGGGKTLSGAQRVRRRIERGARSIALVGPTLREIERYMINGEGGSDGILTVFPASQRPIYKPHKATIHFPGFDAIAYVNSAEDPEFRGPNLDTVWCDEPAKWRRLATIWSNIELATRLAGDLDPEIVITGTPLPLQLFREIIADPETLTIIMRTEENQANLDRRFLARMRRKFGGTRLGRQELEGELLTDNPDALFQRSIIEATRVEEEPRDLEIVVAVDPAISTEPDNDETGILVVGMDPDGHLYVLGDASGKYAPEAWGKLVVDAYEQHRASAVVCERNRGGDLVAANVRAAMERKRRDQHRPTTAAHAIKIHEVQATKGKRIRAEPVSALHEQGRLHFVGTHRDVENEITEWNPRLGGISPNRLDALVWGCWYLARLDEEDAPPKRDPRDAMKGFSALVQELTKRSVHDRGGDVMRLGLPRSEGSLSDLLARLGRGHQGGTI